MCSFLSAGPHDGVRFPEVVPQSSRFPSFHVVRLVPPEVQYEGGLCLRLSCVRVCVCVLSDFSALGSTKERLGWKDKRCFVKESVYTH